jgi:hypothetical protein
MKIRDFELTLEENDEVLPTIVHEDIYQYIELFGLPVKGIRIVFDEDFEHISIVKSCCVNIQQKTIFIYFK